MPEPANGQSNPEYATVILQICGLEEIWIQVGTPPHQEWVCSDPERREAIEKLFQLAKDRTVANVRFRDKAARAIGIVQNFLKSDKV